MCSSKPWLIVCLMALASLVARAQIVNPTPATPIATSSTAGTVIPRDNLTVDGSGNADFTPLDASTIEIKDDFVGTSNSNGSASGGELPWLGRVSGSATFAPGSGTFANPGILAITTGGTSGNSGTIELGDSGTTAFGHLGALGSNAGWDSDWIFQLAQTAATRFRIGFMIETAGTVCGTQVLTSIDANCDGIWLYFDNNAPAAATIAADNATCANAGACRNAGGTIATFTTGTHGFTLVGQTVTIAGVTDTSFNGACVVASIPSPTTFTCPNTGTGSAHSGTGTATPVAETTFQFETKTGSGIGQSSTHSTVVDTTVSADTNFHRLRIRSTAAGTLLFTLYSSSGVLQAGETSINTNVPTGSVIPFAQIVTGANAAKTLNLDFFGYKARGLTR